VDVEYMTNFYCTATTTSSGRTIRPARPSIYSTVGHDSDLENSTKFSSTSRQSSVTLLSQNTAHSRSNSSLSKTSQSRQLVAPPPTLDLLFQLDSIENQLQFCDLMNDLVRSACFLFVGAQL
jgi:hypothetical protein